jgi:hypothetical protein
VEWKKKVISQRFTKVFLPRITRINSNFLVFFLATDALIFLIRLICDNLWQKNLFLICLCGAKQSKITLNNHFFVNLNLFQILYYIFLDAETSSARQEFIFLTTKIHKVISQRFTKVFLPRITRINSNFLVFFLATDAQIFLIRLICDNLWQKNLFLICLCGAKQSKITLNAHFFVNLNLFQILCYIFLLDTETSSARQEFIFLTTKIHKVISQRFTKVFLTRINTNYHE